MGIKLKLHKRIYHAQIRWEDKFVLDSKLPDKILDGVLFITESLQRVYCFFLGHVWDGWRNKAGVWCVFCDKQKVER